MNENNLDDKSIIRSVNVGFDKFTELILVSACSYGIISRKRCQCST